MPRLLERQTALLAYLTSPAAIFAGRRPRRDARLAGLDRGRLHLEARFSHDKRMEKIRGVLPRTFGLLGPSRARVLRGFAAACPPDDISRLRNARQFHDFLRRRWTRLSDRRPYLADVAACELALAEARNFAEDQTATIRTAPSRSRICRRPGVILVRCRYDVRPIFEGRTPRIARRPTFLAVAVRPGADEPAVAGLTPQLFKLLAVLDTPQARVDLGRTTDADALVDALTAEGLVEACP
ncbi:MAG: hypothetical protein JO128_13965 [Alphaproteobacteria bacterium]|nr:hypothetical protein [Alphaproteobacteria bacterium]